MKSRFQARIALPGGKEIGEDSPCLVVAELSGNHKGRFARAARLVRAAAKAGVDAVKLQTYTPDTLTIDSDRPFFRIRHGKSWRGRVLYDLYREAHTPWDWHPELFALARELGLVVFSTPFDASAVAFLEKLSPPLYKIASFEIVDLELIREVARTGRPTILSTGIASVREIDEAVEAFASRGNRKLVLLKCTSSYPAPLSAMNVRAMVRLRERYGLPVGLSDHCLSDKAALAAVALGANVIEKHVTLDRNDGGVDSPFSLTPPEFAGLVTSVRQTEQALGRPDLGPGVAEKGNLLFRRSVFTTREIARGEKMTRQNVRVIRPGHGLAPKFLPRLLGRRAARRIPRGTPMAWNLVRP